jgi:hypothetical protein
MRRLVTLLAALALIGGACGDDTGGDESGESGSTYETVTDLNASLAAADISCDLEYEGLKDADREISQCQIDGEQAVLNIWFNDELRQAIIGEFGDTAAYGANWTVQVATPETAIAVADALDGEVGGDITAD